MRFSTYGLNKALNKCFSTTKGYYIKLVKKSHKEMKKIILKKTLEKNME